MGRIDLTESNKLLRKYWRLIAKMSQGDFAGQFKSQIKGSGLEWQELRPLSASDDARLIDWKSTAKSGRPHVRLFEEERDLRFLLILDLSPEMIANCGREGSPKAELALQVALLLSLLAVNSGDQVGWLIGIAGSIIYYPFSRTISRLWDNYQKVKAKLADYNGGVGVPLTKMLSECAKRCPRDATVILLSDFLSAADALTDFGKLCQALSNNKKILALKINDPVEQDLPSSGLLWLTDPGNGQTKLIDTSMADFRQEWHKMFHDYEVQVKYIFSHYMVGYQQIWTDHDPLPQIANLLTGNYG